MAKLVTNFCLIYNKHCQRHNGSRVLSLWLELSFQLNWICIQFRCRLNTLGPLCLWQCFLNREDEDREINHHGRPVEVGEAENLPSDSVIKVNVTSTFWGSSARLSPPTFYSPCLGCRKRSGFCGRKGSAEGIETFLQQVVKLWQGNDWMPSVLGLNGFCRPLCYSGLEMSPKC